MTLLSINPIWLIPSATLLWGVAPIIAGMLLGAAVNRSINGGNRS